VFPTLGVAPLMGRAFTGDDASERADVAVISERLWHTHFGGDPAIAGKTIPLDGKPVTVIGVAPASFQILYESDLWTLYTPLRSPEQRRMHYLQVLGRLKPGVTIEQSRAAMAASVAAGQRTIRLALVTMPSRCASRMPRLTPAL